MRWLSALIGLCVLTACSTSGTLLVEVRSDLTSPDEVSEIRINLTPSLNRTSLVESDKHRRVCGRV